MNRVWHYSQAGVAGVLTLVELAGLLWRYDPAAFLYPYDDVLAACAVAYFVPGLILSLAINQLILLRRRAGELRRSEKVLLGIEFAAIAMAILFPALDTYSYIETLLVWSAVMILAFIICVTLASPATREPLALAAHPR